MTEMDNLLIAGIIIGGFFGSFYTLIGHLAYQKWQRKKQNNKEVQHDT